MKPGAITLVLVSLLAGCSLRGTANTLTAIADCKDTIKTNLTSGQHDQIMHPFNGPGCGTLSAKTREGLLAAAQKAQHLAGDLTSSSQN